MTSQNQLKKVEIELSDTSAIGHMMSIIYKLLIIYFEVTAVIIYISKFTL